MVLGNLGVGKLGISKKAVLPGKTAFNYYTFENDYINLFPGWLHHGNIDGLHILDIVLGPVSGT
jgi:hypothetical protein